MDHIVGISRVAGRPVGDRRPFTRCAAARSARADADVAAPVVRVQFTRRAQLSQSAPMTRWPAIGDDRRRSPLPGRHPVAGHLTCSVRPRSCYAGSSAGTSSEVSSLDSYIDCRTNEQADGRRLADGGRLLETMWLEVHRPSLSRLFCRILPPTRLPPLGLLLRLLMVVQFVPSD
jgi:hypothetical protein